MKETDGRPPRPVRTAAASSQQADTARRNRASNFAIAGAVFAEKGLRIGPVPGGSRLSITSITALSPAPSAAVRTPAAPPWFRH